MWQATTGRWSGVTGDSYRLLGGFPWMVVDCRHLKGVDDEAIDAGGNDWRGVVCVR